MFWKNGKRKMNKKKAKLTIKLGIILLGAGFILSVLAGLMVNTLMNEIVHSEKEVIVPDITGKTLDQALTILGRKNLSLLKVAKKYDTKVPAGSIISQSPPPGLSVRGGRTVEAVVSSGGQVVFIPEIKGKSLRQAELLLRQASLVMGEQERTYSDTVKRDYIVSQDPESGRIVEKNSYVNVVVSRGPMEVEKIKKMVNLLGRNINKVEVILGELSLEIADVSTVVNDDLKEGTIVSQYPPPGTIVDENTKVNLIISTLSRSQKEVRDETIYYEVTQTGKDREVKIVISDGIGERIVYQATEKGGAKIEVPVKLLGQAKAEIFVDGILIKEESLDGILMKGESLE
jgi:serine/threonine-protein kinase